MVHPLGLLIVVGDNVALGPRAASHTAPHRCADAEAVLGRIRSASTTSAHQSKYTLDFCRRIIIRGGCYGLFAELLVRLPVRFLTRGGAVLGQLCLCRMSEVQPPAPACTHAHNTQRTLKQASTHTSIRRTRGRMLTADIQATVCLHGPYWHGYQDNHKGIPALSRSHPTRFRTENMSGQERRTLQFAHCLSWPPVAPHPSQGTIERGSRAVP